MTNRRKFLRNASVVAAAGAWAAHSSVSAAQNALSNVNASKSFGLQTYSLTVDRNDQEFSNNIPGGLRRVAQMGYSTIEMAGYNPQQGRIGQLPMADFKKFADDAGLKIVSSHVGPAEGSLHTRANLQAHLDHWKRAADHHAAIGCKYIIQPGQPVTRNVAEVQLVGEHYNEIGKVVKAAGLIFGFHNHSGEFQSVVPGGQVALPLLGWPYGRQPEGSQIIMDGLLEAFDPTLVVFELDVYWAVMGRQDPVAWIKKYPNHIKILHIKDVSALGESGMMNFQKIFETAYATGVNDFIVELENYPEGTQFEGVKACADYLLRAPFVK